MAKTAFLILAHHEPEMFGRLVGRLDHPDASIFAHIDRKADIAPFRAAANGRVRFVTDADRTSVYWCGYSTTQATLDLIRTAVAAQPDLERFVLLSGADYPVRPIGEIMNVLDQDVEWLRIDRALDPEGDGWFDRCANHGFLGDNSLLNPRSGRYRLSQLARMVEARWRRRPYGRTIYYGPTWWGLTRAAIDIILAVERDTAEAIGWFRYARVPDEMVVHTLLKHSARAGHIALDATCETPTWHRFLAGLHYVDFENPNPDAPRTLDLGDLEEIRASGALFARKVDPVRSASLLQALDATKPSRAAKAWRRRSDVASVPPMPIDPDSSPEASIPGPA